MKCRAACGACCIAPGIVSPIPGMAAGKPAGVRCVQLDEQFRCRLFGKPERPAFCGEFAAEPEYCGADRVQAMQLLTGLELDTRP